MPVVVLNGQACFCDDVKAGHALSFNIRSFILFYLYR